MLKFCKFIIKKFENFKLLLSVKSEDNSSFLEQHEKSLGETADGTGTFLSIFSENL